MVTQHLNCLLVTQQLELLVTFKMVTQHLNCLLVTQQLELLVTFKMVTQHLNCLYVVVEHSPTLLFSGICKPNSMVCMQVCRCNKYLLHVVVSIIACLCANMSHMGNCSSCDGDIDPYGVIMRSKPNSRVLVAL